jgi:hypothetical protein
MRWQKVTASLRAGNLRWLNEGGVQEYVPRPVEGKEKREVATSLWPRQNSEGYTATIPTDSSCSSKRW